jgi:DnaD/phage-associated family protein
MTPAAPNRTGVVPVPADFITVHLPRITSIVELKVSLHLYSLITAQTTRPRRVSWDALLFDTVLQRSLLVVAPSSAYSDVLSEGLAAAVQRGSFLHVVRSDQHGRAVNWYVVNTVENRRWADVQTDMVSTSGAEAAPDVLRLYEQHIGVVTPMLLAELRAAAQLYPAHWFAEAMREAVVANARSWRYVSKILQTWAKDGRDSHLREPELSADRYTEGAYGDLFRRGSDTSDL